jgi:hypothetical protein
MPSEFQNSEHQVSQSQNFRTVAFKGEAVSVAQTNTSLIFHIETVYKFVWQLYVVQFKLTYSQNLNQRTRFQNVLSKEGLSFDF